MNKLLMYVLLVALSGCGTAPRGQADISESLLQECPQSLYEIEGTHGKALLENIDKNAAVYHACKDSKQLLIEAVRAK